MSLRIRRTSPVSVKLASTLIAIFALVVAPMYGVVESRVANAAGGETLYVNANNGTDSTNCGTDTGADACATIQQAIDNADAGDTVSVADGTYNENINIKKQIALVGSGATITSSQAKELVKVEGNASGTTIKGFNLINEAAHQHVLKLASSANLSKLYVTSNKFESNNADLIFAGNVTKSKFTFNTFDVTGINNNDGPKEAGVMFDATGTGNHGNYFKKNTFTGTSGSVVLSVHGNNNEFYGNNFGATTTYRKNIEVVGTGNTTTASLESGHGNSYGNNLVIINPDSGEFRGAYTDFATAVDEYAKAGDTLVATAGTYDKNITVNKALSFVGNGSIVSGSWLVKSADDIDGVSISGFTFTGNNAIRFENDATDKSSCNISYAPTVELSDCSDNFSTFSNLSITDNKFMGGGEATKFVGVFNDVNVSNNIFTGSSVNVSFVGDSRFKADGHASATSSTGLVISGNTSEQAGNFVNASFTKGAEITNNQVSQSTGSAIYLAGQNVNMTIKGNSITEGDSNAIYLRNANTNTRSANSNIDVTENVISNNARGVKIASGQKVNEDVVIGNNEITGNSVGLVNHTNKMVDATNNWWGDVSGPKDTSNNASLPVVNDGTGNEIRGVVSYGPWCTDANCETTTETAPSNLKTIYNGDEITGDTIGDKDATVTNSWGYIDGATKYEYVFTNPNGDTWKHDFTVTEQTGQVNWNGNATDGKYCFQVRAVFSDSVKSDWAESCFTVDTTAPAVHITNLDSDGASGTVDGSDAETVRVSYYELDENGNTVKPQTAIISELADINDDTWKYVLTDDQKALLKDGTNYRVVARSTDKLENTTTDVDKFTYVKAVEDSEPDNDGETGGGQPGIGGGEDEGGTITDTSSTEDEENQRQSLINSLSTGFASPLGAQGASVLGLGVDEDDDTAFNSADLTEGQSGVLGAEDENDNTGCFKLLGLCWYYWVPIVVIVAVLIAWWGVSRRRKEA